MCSVAARLITICLIVLITSCARKKTLFVELPSSQTNIHFSNNIKETDSINVLDFENVYNGAGVGFGDFNNDGLQDIYFTGNMVPNKLYLNKGNFKFEDVTDAAGVDGKGRWCRGASIVDINNDGLQDIYVCASILLDSNMRQNLLYINQGVDKNGIPHFKEMAAEYGLNDKGHSTQAAFFDYDNDGDLDVFVCTNEIVKGTYPNKFSPRKLDGSSPSTGRLYRNDYSETLHHPVFTNVSRQANILIEGLSHAVTIVDINNDGWKDIYITNDYLSNNLLYINNGDGTFTDELAKYFKHTAANAMGADIEDINNDGLQDVVELDMNPEDNYRKKMMLSPNSYQTYQNSDLYGYEYQYVRNIVQLNEGRRVLGNDSLGDPVFGDIGFFSGIAETDWSWTPMVVDFDNDGYRDIIVTNGFPKDITDRDFVTFRNKAFLVASKQQLLTQIPEVKILNYAFKNNGDLTFTKVSKEWGIEDPSYSNGAAYADLDNDGDMDYVVNNINDEASVYQNLANDNKENAPHWLQVEFDGKNPNPGGFGSLVKIYYDHGKKQVFESNPCRGYLTSIQNIGHFGLGKIDMIDSLLIIWPDHKMQKLTQVKVNQRLKLKQTDARETYDFTKPTIASGTLFRDLTDKLAPNINYPDDDYIDFNVQKLLPHKFSEYGPGLAVGDINGDGREDLVMGGSYGYSTQLLLQQADGKMSPRLLEPKASRFTKGWEDLGILLFDADKDGDLDLYIACGGYENEGKVSNYQDKFYINDGKGNFTLDTTDIPKNYTSKSCVRAVDFDKDGDLDLFVAGRLEPWHYPKPVSCAIYRNDSKDGKIKFTDVTETVAKDLINIGLSCDASFSDFDNDGWPDLILAGEWMPIRFFHNDKGIFKDITASTGVQDKKGWWNSILPGDFDNDGKMDYVLGNMGLNSFYRASEKYPVRIYGKDFDNNGSYDAIPTIYLPAVDGQMKEFPAQGRDDLIKQMIEMRRKFLNYKSYADAGIDKLLSPEQLKGAVILEANTFSSCLLHNLGGGKFEIKPLPAEAQFSTLNGMVAQDFNGDGNLDLIINGNDFGTEVSVGRYDAMNALLLTGDGKGNFTPWRIQESGIYVPGNAKALVMYRSATGKAMVAAGQNKGALRVFEWKSPVSFYPVKPDDAFVIVHNKNGSSRKEEFLNGASFLSQSGRFFARNDAMVSAEIVDSKGNKRSLF